MQFRKREEVRVDARGEGKRRQGAERVLGEASGERQGVFNLHLR